MKLKLPDCGMARWPGGGTGRGVCVFVSTRRAGVLLRPRARRGGFSILEILVALGLLVALSGTVFGLMWNFASTRERLVSSAREAGAGGVFIDRLESDLAGLLAGDPGVGAGVSGKATSLRVLTRGVGLSPDGAVGLSARDMHGAEYSFDAGRGELLARRWVVEPEGAGERAAPGRAPEPAAGDGPEVLARGVAGVRFRYHDGNSWVGSFDSLAAGGLPVAVEVSVWFGGQRRSDGATERRREGGDELDEFGPGGLELDGGWDGSGWDGSGWDGSPSRPMDPELTQGRGAGDPFDQGNGRPPLREPDRRRIIVVPDGPLAPWKEGR